jgi:hypothetical protein
MEAVSRKIAQFHEVQRREAAAPTANLLLVLV